MKTAHSIVLVALLLFFGCAENKETPDKYEWKNVQIVGGGFVSGIVFHSSEKNLRYCRTDMGGAYRWDELAQRWTPLLDWLSLEEANLMGVESIALDPNNPDMLYMACGTYTKKRFPNGAILRSSDRGETFERIDVPFKFGGNEIGRGNGERMMVNPLDENIIYLGTRHNGLWRSTDQGKTWNQVESFPDVHEEIPEKPKDYQGWWLPEVGSGIVTVLFDTLNIQNSEARIFIAASLKERDNFFYSGNGGVSWKPVPNHPDKNRVTQAVLSSDGFVYITYGSHPGPYRMNDGSVWKMNTTNFEWTDITPVKIDEKLGDEFGYAAVSVDQQNPKNVIVSTFPRKEKFGGDDIFRSTDGGKTWKGLLNKSAEFDYTKAPYVARTPIHWMFDIEIDPFNPNHAMFVTGFGGFETFDLTNADKNETTHWQVMSTGIEETVALELLSPAKGAPLISAIGDYGGFVHWDLDKPAPEGNFDTPHFGNTTGVDCAIQNPETIVRVGVGSGNRGGGDIGVSHDAGKTWKAVNKPNEECKYGNIAVSADGKSWLWSTGWKGVFVTKDEGKTWIESEDIPNKTRVISDKVNPNVFYGFSIYEGKVYISTNGGESFEANEFSLPTGLPDTKDIKIRGDKRSGLDRIYATPGIEGELWLAAYDGLYITNSDEINFRKLPQVEEIHGFGFGKEAPGKNYPTLYLIGVVNGVRGIFRSTDKAQSWLRINNNQHQWGLVFHITGDPKKFGRVYVGTHGRGIFYGDVAKSGR